MLQFAVGRVTAFVKLPKNASAKRSLGNELLTLKRLAKLDITPFLYGEVSFDTDDERLPMYALETGIAMQLMSGALTDLFGESEWLWSPIGQTQTEQIVNPFCERSSVQLGSIMAQLETLVKGLHGAGVRHGDLKPGNIVVMRVPRETGVRLRLIDFGSATYRPGQSSCVILCSVVCSNLVPCIDPRLSFPLKLLVCCVA